MPVTDDLRERMSRMEQWMADHEKFCAARRLEQGVTQNASKIEIGLQVAQELGSRLDRMEEEQGKTDKAWREGLAVQGAALGKEIKRVENASALRATNDTEHKFFRWVAYSVIGALGLSLIALAFHIIERIIVSGLGGLL